MNIGVYFSLIAIFGGFTIQISETAKSWSTLSVSIPPSITEDETNFTYVQDGNGGFMKVHQSEAKNVTNPDFFVEKDVRFELFTPENPLNPQFLTLNNFTSVNTSNFNWQNPTRILIHGWYSEGLLTSRFADAYFVRSQHKLNYIAVNWQKGSDIYNYFTARGRVKDVAEYVAKFVDFMSAHGQLKVEQLMIIGHSLGAHIAGIAGKNIKSGKVGKIVGLDPASPWFDYNDYDGRLTESDASYVETIHTCAGTLGFAQPIGMASFYPNGGKSQPGCKWDVAGACAHGRAYEYYIESIVSPTFYAFECDSFLKLQRGDCSVVNVIIPMGGEPGIRRAEGIFYLKTNPEPMFSQGRNGILQEIISAKDSYKKVALDSWLKAKNYVKSIQQKFGR